MPTIANIEYRPALASDADAITSLMLQESGLFDYLFDGTIPGMAVHNILKQQVAINLNELSHKNTIVAVKEDTIVGIMHSYPSTQFKITLGMRIFVPSERLKHVANFFCNRVEDSLYIHCLTTQVDEQREDVLVELFEQAKTKAGTEKLTKISTNIWADNQPAQKLFENFGFKPYKTVPIEKNARIPHEGGSIIMEYVS